MGLTYSRNLLGSWPRSQWERQRENIWGNKRHYVVNRKIKEAVLEDQVSFNFGKWVMQRKTPQYRQGQVKGRNQVERKIPRTDFPKWSHLTWKNIWFFSTENSKSLDSSLDHSHVSLYSTVIYMGCLATAGEEPHDDGQGVRQTLFQTPGVWLTSCVVQWTEREAASQGFEVQTGKWCTTFTWGHGLKHTATQQTERLR